MMNRNPNNESENESSSQPIGRLFRVMEAMSSFRTPVRLIDLAKNLGMSQSTVYRYVHALCAMGYAYCDDSTGYYALTWKICSLGNNINNQLVLHSIVSPFLYDLANSLNVSSCLVVMSGNKTSYLDFISNPMGSGSDTIRIGHNAPIHTSGSGKVLLSALPKSEVIKIINNTGLIALTSKTITDENAFLKELENVSALGYAIDDEECELGYRCISVPVKDYSHRTVAAISVFDIVEHMSDDRIAGQIVPALFQASKTISFRLGAS